MQVWRLGIVLLVAIAAMLLVMTTLMPAPRPVPTHRSSGEPNLPPASAFHELNAAERTELTTALHDLSDHLGLNAGQAESAEDLIARLDRHLGTPNPAAIHRPTSTMAHRCAVVPYCGSTMSQPMTIVD